MWIKFYLQSDDESIDLSDMDGNCYGSAGVIQLLLIDGNFKF